MFKYNIRYRMVEDRSATFHAESSELALRKFESASNGFSARIPGSQLIMRGTEDAYVDGVVDELSVVKHIDVTAEVNHHYGYLYLTVGTRIIGLPITERAAPEAANEFAASIADIINNNNRAAS